MSLRPITRKIPYTHTAWDETYLPMCAVMSPLQDDNENKEEEDDEAAGQTIANVIKCLSCGAPHPTSTTHYRFGSKILCYLCGEISSIVLQDQQIIRQGEWLDLDLFDKYDHLTPKEAREKKKKTADGDEDDDYDEAFDFSTDTIEFRMPVAPGKSLKEPIWQFPAIACPPVWWIIVDGTVGNNNTVGATRNYWTTVGATISKALEEIPPHVHVGLLTATGSRLASWDLTSAVPHVKQFPYSYVPIDGNTKDGEMPNEPWDLCLVPANSHYKANLEVAIRGMVDGAMSGLFLQGSSDNGEEKKTNGESNNSEFFPLGLTLEILLEYMDHATHPGHDEESEEGEDNSNSNGMTKLRYAGGKIMCLLGNPTLETGTPPKNDSMSYMDQPGFGLGGVAGVCGRDYIEPRSAPRETKSNEKDTKKKEPTDPSDLTTLNLKDYVMPLEPEDLFVNIGRCCAKAALGVDLIVLVPEEDEGSRGGLQTIPWYGLPLLRPLSEASGAPGPLMFGTGNIGSVEVEESTDPSEEKSPDSYYAQKFERLYENVIARTPWQSGMVFGAQIKLRLSPGFKLEDTPLPKNKKNKIDLSQFLSFGGMSGPASLLSGDEGEEKGRPTGSAEDKLYIMGSCDPHTSFVIDLATSEDGHPDGCMIDGVGEVDVKPVIQTCMLYTSIETDNAQPTPSYYTVCKMRVSSVAFDLVEDDDSIYDGLDTEALAVVIFNKIAIDAYVEGLVVSQTTIERWTSSVLSALYASAQKKAKAAAEEGENDLEFDISDRLLNQEDGSLNETSVLLGEGHFKAQFIPLLTYSIAQCDAYRPSEEGYNPSMDARLCALTQMSSMTPKALANTLAPFLSLWSLKEDKAILDSLPLAKEEILKELEVIDEEITKNSVLFLESTQGIFLFTADNLEESGSKGVKKTKKSSFWNQYLTIGPNFRETIKDAMARYRTLPPQWKAIEELFDQNRYIDLDNIEIPFAALQPMMVEDMPTFGGDKNYSEWKSKIAGFVKDEIGVTDGTTSKSQGWLRFSFGRK